MPDPVEIEGLREAREALKRVSDPEKSKTFKAIGYDIGREVVIPAARQLADTPMQRRAAATLEPIRTATGGAVRLGKGFPGSMGAEFGADRNQRRQGRPHGKVGPVTGWNQFQPWRGSGSDAGYFFYPAVRAETDTIIERYADGFDQLWAGE